MITAYQRQCQQYARCLQYNWPIFYSKWRGGICSTCLFDIKHTKCQCKLVYIVVLCSLTNHQYFITTYLVIGNTPIQVHLASLLYFSEWNKMPFISLLFLGLCSWKQGIISNAHTITLYYDDVIWESWRVKYSYKRFHVMTPSCRRLTLGPPFTNMD